MAGQSILFVRMAGSTLTPFERLLSMQMGLASLLMITLGLDALFRETS